MLYARIFCFQPFLGMPWCRDYVIDLELAASAMQAEFRTHTAVRIVDSGKGNEIMDKGI